MMYNAIELRDKKREELKTKVLNYVNAGYNPPCLAIIQVGNVPESNKYVGNKLKALELTGMSYQHIHLSANVDTMSIRRIIDDLNKDHNVHGIMIQLPLPKHIDSRYLLDYIDPDKDVDGLGSYSLGSISVPNTSTHLPCTVAGVVDIMHDMIPDLDLKGKNVVVLGKGITSGLPLTYFLMTQGANVVNLASKCSEEDRYKYIRNADIVVSCVGIPHFINLCEVPKKCVLINVGMFVNEEGKLMGDYNHIHAEELGIKCTSIVNCTGIMTVQHLLENVFNAYEWQK